MQKSVFPYPNSDEVPYLDWFCPRFTSVFVALTPFIRVLAQAPYRNGHATPREVEVLAKRRGQECAVSWSEIAYLCGFATCAEVNQALRGLGARRTAAEYAAKDTSDILMKHCQASHLYPPDEGCPSPPFAWSLGGFAQAAGQDTLLASDVHGPRERLDVSELTDPEQLNGFSELTAPDKSFYATINTDYCYWLICQTEASLAKARPDAFFEGFYATEATNDFWGLGSETPVGPGGAVGAAVTTSLATDARRAQEGRKAGGDAGR